MPRVLLIDDAEDVHLIVRSILQPEFQLQIASTIAEAESQLKRSDTLPDLILLDLLLPDGDGLAMCNRLKRDRELAEIPVIILTGRNDISAKVTGFSLGADDFLAKPFEPIELLMRVRTRIKGAVMRRYAESSWMRGDLRVDSEAREISVVTDHGETKLELSPIDFKVLIYFLKHEGMVLTRDQIMNAGWGENTYLGERTVDVHVSHLRKRLQDGGSVRCSIQSVHKVGYKFKISRVATTRESLVNPA